MIARALKSGCIALAVTAVTSVDPDEFSVESCGQALLECQDLCALRGGVNDHECWGSTSEVCLKCICSDGHDYTGNSNVCNSTVRQG